MGREEEQNKREQGLLEAEDDGGIYNAECVTV
jgi:hypothetical protein